MTTFPAAMRPARVNRLFISALLVAAGFLAGIGVARFAPATVGGVITTPVTVPAGIGGRSPDERQELRDARPAIEPANEGLSPDERDGLD
jgi:hypothetical protein